jgi:hypothetical protein
MNASRDPETILAAWLDEGPTDLPDATRRAILTALPTTSQARRGLFAPRRFPRMNTYIRLAMAALVAVVAVGGALYVLGPSQYGSGAPSPSPTLASTPGPSSALSGPSPAPTLDPTSWTTFTSSQYGLTIGHPADWRVLPATRAWSFQTDAENWLSPAEDAFFAPGDAVRVAAWAVPLTDPQMNQSWPDLERWVVDYCQRTKNTDCATIHDRVVPLCIEKRDCHPALLVPFADDVQAFGYGGVLPEGMMVIVTVGRGESDPHVAPYGGATHLLEAFLSTMNVFPPFYPEAQNAAATFVTTGQ